MPSRRKKAARSAPIGPPRDLNSIDDPTLGVAERVRGRTGKLYHSTSLFCLLPGHEPRKCAIKAVEAPLFDPFILITIFANCVTMAWQSPLDLPGTWKEHVIDACEWVFLAIFTAECATKITAYGFLMHTGSYLRDPWCQLDFTVVALAWLPILFPSMGSYNVLRAFRALRPLRALKRVPGMPVLVEWILSVLPKMGNVLMLCGFVFLVFGIVGVEFFKGTLHYRCALMQGDSSGEPDNTWLPRHLRADVKEWNIRYLLADVDAAVFDTGRSCSPRAAPGAYGACPHGSSCTRFATNPDHGITSFDSVPMAGIAFIEGITFDGWATPMYDLMAAASPYAWVYFVLVVSIAGFFVVNLFLAVIFLEFGKTREKLHADMAQATAHILPSSVDLPPPAALGIIPGPLPLSAEQVAAAPNGQELLLAEGTVRSDDVADGARQQQRDGNGSSGTDGDDDDDDDDTDSSDDDDEDDDDEEDGGACSRYLPTVDCSADGHAQRLRAIASSDALGHSATALVLMNMILMCMPYYGMSEGYAARLEAASSLITWLFILEFALKLAGLGCAEYWADGWNCLDGSIVSMSLVEIVATALASGTGVQFAFLRILRMLRVLRILRLMRAWRGLYHILRTFMRATQHMFNIAVLLLLAVFIFALLGMQLFGGIFNEEAGYSPHTPCGPGGVCADGLKEKPHTHFDYCYPAVLTVFVLMTGEWVDAMEPVAALLGPPAALFFLSIALLGKYLLLNLLVAVLISEFQEGGEAAGGGQPPLTARSDASGGGVSSAYTTPNNSVHGGKVWPSSPSSTARRVSIMSERYDPTTSSAHRGSVAARRGSLAHLFEQAAAPAATADPPWPEDHSLLLFAPSHPLRVGCQWGIRQPWFDPVVIAAIVASSVCLALDSPRLDPASPLAFWLEVSDLFFTAFFTCEMALKVIALGFVLGKHAYLRSPWNQVDFAIVCVSLLVLLAEAFPALRPLRVLRMMRVLRPLRLISRNAGMKLIITSLLEALPAVGNVFGVVLTLQSVFAILGMQLFAGELGACAEKPSLTTRAECLGEGHLWANPVVGSFDDFGSGMRLLYVMSTGDQWEVPMYIMMGASAPDVAPRRDDFGLASIFALCWMFSGYVFAINLFVGVVIDNFSRNQKLSDGTAVMTKEQQQWASTMKALASAVPSKGTRKANNALRRRLQQLVSSRAFDGFITAVIVANVGLMACNYDGIDEDPSRLHAYNRAMDAFAIIYYIEATLKLSALGLDGYFGDNWCRFDFFLVCTSLVDQFATELLAGILPMPPMLLRVLRVFRILRILRLLRHAKQLRDLIVTMVLSFPSLLNVTSLLALILFMYAVLGVHLFTFVAHGDPLETAHGGINDERNFDTLGAAVLVLMQCLTSDGWSTVMAALMKDETSGECSRERGDCGSPYAAIPYFISFQILGSFVFLNLVVAVILENFAKLYFESPDLVSASDLEVFNEAWADFDPDATNWIAVTKLPRLLLQVPRPLGVRGQTLGQATRLCMRLQLPQRNGCVAYHELLQELIQNNFFRTGDLDEDAFMDALALMPPLELKIPKPPQPPPARASDAIETWRLGGEDDEGGDGEPTDTTLSGALPAEARAQESIAEVFAMATIFKEDIRNSFLRSLRRARRRIEWALAKPKGKTELGGPQWAQLPDKDLEALSEELCAVELVGVGRPYEDAKHSGSPYGKSSTSSFSSTVVLRGKKKSTSRC